MSKIVLVGNSDVSIYNYRYELIERLIVEGHEVYVVTPFGALNQEMVNLGAKHVEVSFNRRGTNPFSDLKLLKKYVKVFKEISPDFVFTYTIKPNIYASMACKKLNIPCIVNITGLGSAVENGGIMQRITVALYRWSLKKVKTIFFQNESNKAFFVKKKINVKAHKLLPGSGVNLKKFQPFEYPVGDVVEFVFVSRLMKEKGIEHYIDAAEIITKKYPNTRFHICGSSEKMYESKMEELKNNPNIIYHGRVKDVSEVLNKVHCTIHPTYYPEGMSNVLLESLACARPIITTDRAGCKEIVDDGVNGFIVKQKDTLDLVQKIEKFLALDNEQRKQMGIAGRQKVEREFDRNFVIEKYLEEIKC